MGINMDSAHKNSQSFWEKNTWMAFDQLCQIFSRLVIKAGDAGTGYQAALG